MQDNLVDAYYQAIQGHQRDDYGYYAFPCSTKLSDFAVGIGANGYKVILHGSQIMGPPHPSLPNMCTGNIYSCGTNCGYQIMGAIMLQNHFVVHDMVTVTDDANLQPQVGFADRPTVWPTSTPDGNIHYGSTTIAAAQPAAVPNSPPQVVAVAAAVAPAVAAVVVPNVAPANIKPTGTTYTLPYSMVTAVITTSDPLQSFVPLSTNIPNPLGHLTETRWASVVAALATMI